MPESISLDIWSNWRVHNKNKTSLSLPLAAAPFFRSDFEIKRNKANSKCLCIQMNPRNCLLFAPLCYCFHFFHAFSSSILLSYLLFSSFQSLDTWSSGRWIIPSILFAIYFTPTSTKMYDYINEGFTRKIIIMGIFFVNCVPAMQRL